MIDEKAKSTVAKALYEAMEGPVNNQDFARQQRQWESAQALAVVAIEAYESAKPKGAEGWRDIKTDPPPMDGRMAIVFRPLARNTQDEPVALKRLLGGHQGCWPATVPAGSESYNPTDGSCHVTHWRPLPEPPSAMLSAAGDANDR